MSEIRKSPIQIDGRKGIIVHDKLTADGPVDPVTGEPLIDPKTGQPYEGPNDDLADLIHDYLVSLRGQVHLKDGAVAPRFGVLSLLAKSTPIYIYDHPRFKSIANTAFTDGTNVFIDADFMRKLVHQEEDSVGKYSGVLFLLLHELMHKLYCHVDRLKAFPHDIANIAEDLVINGKLIKGFTMLKPVPLLAEIGQGMKQEEADKYYNMSEEMVAEMLMRAKYKKDKEEKEKQKEKDKQQKQDSGQDQGDPNHGGNEEGQEQDGQGGEDPSDSQDGKKQSNNGKPKEKGDSKEKGGQGGDEEGEGNENEEGEYSPIHHISPEELIEILEEEGLMDTVGKALKLPASDDIEGIGRKKEETRMKVVDAVQEAMSDAAKIGHDIYPGSHIAESVADIIGDLNKGKIIYKLAIKKHFLGDGQKLRYTDDEAAIPWYLDKDSMGVDPFYTGAMIPHAPDESVLVLVDTSGSTGGGDTRKQFLQEALGIKKSISSSGDSARKVFIWSADTVLRGEPVLITDANIEKMRHDGIPIFGDGGTSFKDCLQEALATPLMKKEKIKAVIYFTDCGDSVPQRADFEEHLNNGVSIVFITTPGFFNEKWNQELRWAEVYCIEEGTVVDMDKQPGQVNTNTRKNNVR
ncbi:MAG: hypothetical protein C0448_16015 [Sphingobacteriaceae bacterium]|nr:hypothetical protein [Sphingobacteriaceae bacterium]